MDIVQSLLETYGWAALVLILFLDSSGFPWPTEATLVVAGIAAKRGSPGIVVVFLSVLAGAALGSTLSYYLGRRMGPTLMRRIAAFFRLSDDTMNKVDDWFERHGHRAVFFGRLVPFVRNFTGYPAGVMEVPFGKYMLFSLAGYGLYAAFALSLGYFGTAFTQWVGDFEIALWLMLPIALLAIWFKWGRKWVQQQRMKERGKG
ncbi:MAG TPA: DedA family protein [Symbiobacteriaceae bacterium]|nr:DedA family protein [Symbiobacteriaceae bacterium]